ncbi:MAG: discoidin domain-containing protein, partial [Bacteroidota bacterium]
MQTLRYIVFLFITALAEPFLIAQSSPCSEPINLALGKQTQQSSTKASGHSSLAVDGKLTGGDPWNGEIQHTQKEIQPWWQVDLGQVAQLSEIQLYNRTNCCQERLRNFVVLLSEQPFPETSNLDQLLSNPSIEAVSYAGATQVQYVFTSGAQARYVRIQLRGTASLHMAEVVVTGCLPTEAPSIPEELTPTPIPTPPTNCSNTSNLALGKPSKQSSTKASGYAELAVDGILTGGDPWKGEIQHTQNQGQPWWQVDLEQEHTLSEIILYNRTDCCQGRLRNFVVLLSAQAFPENASLDELLSHSGIEAHSYTGDTQEQYVFPVETQARHVRVQLRGSTSLHMAEVIVNGCNRGEEPQKEEIPEGDPPDEAPPITPEERNPTIGGAPEGLQKLLDCSLEENASIDPLYPSKDQNYIRKTQYRSGSARSHAEKDKVQHLTYYDGLGRPIQSIEAQATPQG